MLVKKPESGTFDAYYQMYIDMVDTNYLEAELDTNMHKMGLFVLNMDDDKWHYRYDEDKWSIAEVIMHICDVEQMFCNRVLNMVRGLKCEFDGFDHDLMAKNSISEKMTPKRYMELYTATRNYTVALAKSFMPEDWEIAGVVVGKKFTVKSLYYCMIGHERHHLNVINERYL